MVEELIKQPDLSHDAELANAMNAMKNDPSKLQLFIQNQQDNVYRDIVKQKEDRFEKVYGELNHAAKMQESNVMYNKRNQEMADIQESLYNRQKNESDAVSNDKNMATRKNEMNEWSVHNKNETLFVFSSLFIMLSVLLLLTVLWRMGIIPSTLWVGIGLPFILIFVLIVVNRSQYTDVLRNKRYWNKKIFDGSYGKIPIPSICPGGWDNMENGITSMEQNVQDEANSIVNDSTSAAQSAQNAAQQLMPSS
jgi:hypothetical protein